MHTVRTGEPAFPRHFGLGFWDDLSADSGRAASFDALMRARLVADAPAVAVAYLWGTLGHVVDVGGGNASLLIAILRAHGDLRGTVIDLAGPVARAEQAIVSAGLGHRAGTQVGNFFDALPAGAGGYVLSAVLPDWDDEDAVRILQRCADAASETGNVLVVDHISDAQGGTPDTEGDLRMLCYVRGREQALGRRRSPRPPRRDPAPGPGTPSQPTSAAAATTSPRSPCPGSSPTTLIVRRRPWRSRPTCCARPSTRRLPTAPR